MAEEARATAEEAQAVGPRRLGLWRGQLVINPGRGRWIQFPSQTRLEQAPSAPRRHTILSLLESYLERDF